MGTKAAKPKAYIQPPRKPQRLPRLRLRYVYAYPAAAIRRVNPMTTNPSARQPMPPRRNESGVDPPATAATPPVFRSMAIAGDSTDTEIAMASIVRKDPFASSPVCRSPPGARDLAVATAAPGPSLPVVAICALPFDCAVSADWPALLRVARPVGSPDWCQTYLPMPPATSTIAPVT